MIAALKGEGCGGGEGIGEYDEILRRFYLRNVFSKRIKFGNKWCFPSG